MTRRNVAVVLIAVATGVLAAPAHGKEKSPSNVGKKVAPFGLTDPRTKKTVTLADFKDRKAIVIVFTGTQCPINNASMPTLRELAVEYRDKGVAFLAINANAQDSAD